MHVPARVALVFLLLSLLLPSANAGGFSIPGIRIPGLPGGGDPMSDIYKRIGESLEVGSPLLLDQHTAFADASDSVTDFHPKLLHPNSLQDMSKPLPPGDYVLPVMAYCTQYSIHAPGQGLPYKLARVQGKQSADISAFLIRGTAQGIDPSTLNADAWRMEAGVPLSEWDGQDQSLVNQLIPEREKDLQGDFLQKINAQYNSLRWMHNKPSLDAILSHLGTLGQAVLAVEAGRQTLTNTTVSAERLPDMLYQPQGDGLPRVLPPSDDPSPSPWAEVRPGVLARFTIIDGNLGRNRFEFRITPEALASAKGIGDTATPHVILASVSPQSNPAAAGPSLADIMGMSGEDQDKLLIGYSENTAAQALILGPILPNPPTDDPSNTETPSPNATSSPSSVLPTITSITPLFGSVGTSVTIIGTGFTGVTTVSFNGTAAKAVTVISDNDLTVAVPFYARSGAISVSTSCGIASSSNNFKLLLPQDLEDQARVYFSDPNVEGVWHTAYRDSTAQGYVTIGIGHMIPNATRFKSILFTDQNGSPADVNALQGYWNRLQASPVALSADHYVPLAQGLSIPDSVVSSLFDSDYIKTLKGVGSQFQSPDDYIGLPEPALLALMDLQYSTKRGLSGFPNLMKAVLSHDWLTAMQQCDVPQHQLERNGLVAGQFYKAYILTK